MINLKSPLNSDEEAKNMINLKSPSSSAESGNGGKSSDSATSDDSTKIYLAKFQQKVDEELQKIASKYQAQIDSYTKKGLNPLTKKLIEKAQKEMENAQSKRREEMEKDKDREVDKIRAGLSMSLPDDVTVNIDRNFI